MNKRCVSISSPSAPGAKAVVSFADGTTASADIVIGADGIKSAVRGAVTGHDPMQDVRFSNSVCYRGLVPMAKLQETGLETDLTRRPVCFIGKDKVRFGLGFQKAYRCSLIASSIS